MNEFAIAVGGSDRIFSAVIGRFALALARNKWLQSKQNTYISKEPNSHAINLTPLCCEGFATSQHCAGKLYGSPFCTFFITCRKWSRTKTGHEMKINCSERIRSSDTRFHKCPDRDRKAWRRNAAGSEKYGDEQHALIQFHHWPKHLATSSDPSGQWPPLEYDNKFRQRWEPTEHHRANFRS